jgi:superfamily II DNA/RNA helicase
VHVDPPAEHKAYLHRSGRTARAGAGGTVVTVSTPDQAGEVRLLTRQAGIAPTVTSVRPGAPEITALTGPAAPHVEPAPAPAPQPQGQGGGRRRRGGSGSSTTAKAGAPRTATSKAGTPKARPTGPARTRAELAARAGTSSAASFSARSRRGR